jgi:hypothetical protein
MTTAQQLKAEVKKAAKLAKAVQIAANQEYCP